jgi:hypothetical protein
MTARHSELSTRGIARNSKQQTNRTDRIAPVNQEQFRCIDLSRSRAVDAAQFAQHDHRNQKSQSMSPATAAILNHDFCSPNEARAILRIGRNCVYAAIRDGSIPHVKIGGVLKVPVSWLKKHAGIVAA